MSKPLAAAFASKAYLYLGTPYDELDCQALLEAMLKDVGVKKNWKGSNAMYRDMAWVGTPEECKKKFGSIPVGAWIFILEDDGNEPSEYKRDGIGNASHVGVKTGGKKGAIHSSSSRGMVAESTFKDKTIANGGWNRIGLCKLIDYGDKIEEILYGNTKRQEQETVQVALTEDKIEETKQEEVTIAMITATVQTSGGILNIREMPSSAGRDIGDIPNGASVQVLEKTNSDWWKVSYCGVTGYCACMYLKEVQSVSITLTKETAGALYQALSEVLVD